MIPTPRKTFELRPISELMSMVRNDFRRMDDEGLIDEGTVIKTIMACNDRLGIPIRQIKQVCIPVEEFKAKLPLNFEKLYFVSALSVTNTMVHSMRNPFDNKFDRDALYEAELDRGTIGCTDCYSIVIKREQNITVHSAQSLINLDVNKISHNYCHSSSPNTRRKGKYSVTIDNEYIHTPFRSGELYIMYLSLMEDEYGNLLYPFHPLITPYYEWSIKEKVLMDAIFNSDETNADLLKLATAQRVKAWLDAYNFTTDKGYGEFVDLQRNKEYSWHNQYFKYFQ